MLVETGSKTEKKRGARRRVTSENTAQAQFILHHAITLFSEQGYAAATMDDLAARTGLNKGTLYYYYPSKGQILFQICSVTIDGALELVRPLVSAAAPAAALERFVDRYVDWLAENISSIVIMEKERNYRTGVLTREQMNSLADRERQFVGALTQTIRNAVTAGDFASCNPSFAAGSLLMLLNSTTSWNALKNNRAELALSLKAFAFRGLMKR